MEILKFFPNNIQNVLRLYEFNSLEEIRLRASKPIILKYHNKEEIIKHVTTPNDLLEALNLMCSKSIYSYQKQICNRFYYS